MQRCIALGHDAGEASDPADAPDRLSLRRC
jgi:hypothetical protein